MARRRLPPQNPTSSKTAGCPYCERESSEWNRWRRRYPSTHRCRSRRRRRRVRFRPSRQDARLAADIGECAVSVVAVKDVGQAVVHVGMAVGPSRSGERQYLLFFGGEIHVSRHVEIDVAVVIDISEGATGAPQSGADAGIRSDVGEAPLAGIAVEPVEVGSRDVEIGPSIVVVVRRAGAHAETRDAMPDAAVTSAKRAVPLFR